jgi:hypothetical protein
MRFSLKWLLTAVAFIAVCLFALLHANVLGRVGTQGAVLLSLLIGSAGAMFSVRGVRAFCGGYVLFAIPFLAVFFGFKSGSDFISTRMLEIIHSQAFSPTTEMVRGPFYPATYEGDVLTVTDQPDASLLVTAIRPKRQDFVSVGHAILSVPFSVLGGLVALAFYRRRPSPG